LNRGPTFSSDRREPPTHREALCDRGWTKDRGRVDARTRGRADAQTPKKRPEMSAKILVIDDSEKIRRDVRQALMVAGYEIIEAVDGVDGLEKLRANGDVALALCDVNMPRMTGLELLATIFKDTAATRPRTPIMMLTTEGQPSLIRRAQACGAKGWIVKPFKADLLLRAVRKLIADAAAAAAAP